MFNLHCANNDCHNRATRYQIKWGFNCTCGAKFTASAATKQAFLAQFEESAPETADQYDGPEIHSVDFIGQANGYPTAGFIDPLTGKVW